MSELPQRVREAEARREFRRLLHASSAGPIPDRRSPLIAGVDRGEWCVVHARYELDRAGDYRSCGECCHIWRTKAAFMRDVLADRDENTSHELGDLTTQATCPLCGSALWEAHG